MDFARDQLFASPGFAENQHGSFRGGDEINLADDVAQGTALSNQFAKGACFDNFFFEIFVLLLELIFQALDFLERAGVGDGSADMVREDLAPGM